MVDDGIDGRQDLQGEDGRHGSGFPNWLGIVVFGAIVALGLSGWMGGGPSPERLVRTTAADIRVKTPHRIRNGNLFETRIIIEAKDDIAKPVLVVSQDLWRDITINSFYPGAEEEATKDRFRLFRYPPMKVGDRLDIQIDGQVNPPLIGRNKGVIALRDGERNLAELPIGLQVLP